MKDQIPDSSRFAGAKVQLIEHCIPGEVTANGAMGIVRDIVRQNHTVPILVISRYMFGGIFAV
jgi:hypothetical protein